jgi:hypothetical protein
MEEVSFSFRIKHLQPSSIQEIRPGLNMGWYQCITIASQPVHRWGLREEPNCQLCGKKRPYLDKRYPFRKDTGGVKRFNWGRLPNWNLPPCWTRHQHGKWEQIMACSLVWTFIQT